MKISTDIKGKRVLLMGACGVLGRAHTRILIEHEALLIIADRPGSRVLEDAKLLGIYGLEIEVSNEEAIVDGVLSASRFYNGLDGAIYNSAITSEALASNSGALYNFEDYPLNLWQKAIEINLTGSFLFAREIGKIFKKNGGGSLINISSIYGVVAPDHRIYENQKFQSFPAYSASKAGIIGLSRWLSTYWAKDSIRVNCVSPGGVYNDHNKTFIDAYSERVPMGRMADNEDITGIIIYLLSESSRYCTGQNFIIDGGLSVW